MLVPDGFEPGRSMVRLRHDNLALAKIGVLAATVITCYKIYEIPLPMDAYMPAAGSAGLSPKSVVSILQKSLAGSFSLTWLRLVRPDSGRQPYLSVRKVQYVAIGTALIEPGKRWQNGAKESFNDSCVPSTSGSNDRALRRR